MPKSSKESQAEDGGLVTAKRIMERLVNTPHIPHKDTKADAPPGKPKRGRPPKKQS